MADSTTSFGRRVFLRSATAAATIATIELTGAGTASAHDRYRHGDDHHRHDHPRAPHTVALPDGLQPEGITSGPGTRYYVGSLANGRIVTGDLLAATSSVLLAGATGRSLRGLSWDPRTNLVWAVGSLGSAGKVYAVNARTGAIVAEVTVPGAKFLNDLVVTHREVWVTDSFVDRLTRISLHHGGAPSGQAPRFVPLRGAWPAGNGKDFWANGIRQLPDGSLVLNNTTAGGLWQVDRATGVARSIRVTGGRAITSGDGLVIRGDVLYNVRGTGGNDVAVLRLHRRHDRWEARWLDDLTDSTLDSPSTATLAGGWLWAVNARFTVASPTTAHYWITRLPAHRH